MICYLFSEPLYFLFTSGVPALLYYAYIPTTFIALFLGIYVYRNGKHLLFNKLFFVICILFSLWTISTLIEWTNIHSGLILFVWSFAGIISGLIAILSVYFIYVFLEKKNLTTSIKSILILAISPVILLSPTSLNLSGFDINACDAFKFWWLPYKIYYTLLGMMAMIWIFVLMARKYRVSTVDMKKQIILMGTGIEFFLSLFFIWTSYTYYLTQIGVDSDSRLEMYGLLGMVIFLIYIGILMVRFKVFNTKLIATQALVWTSIILISSQFFFIQTNINKVLTGLTLIVFSVVGWLIVRSVKKEIRQRQEIEHLLKIKSEFIDIVSHQLRTPVSVIKGMASMLKEGDLDNQPKEKRDEFIAGIYEKSEKLADILNDILKAAELDMDNFSFTPANIKPINLSQLVKGIFDDLFSLAQAKKLNYQINISPEIANLNVMTDESFLKHVFQNITDNAIKYSRDGGSTTVDLSKEKDFFICKIIDSGIGIPEDQKDRLFEKFFRAKNAVDVHAYGTGLGLFIAKKIVEAHHGGKIWFDSTIGKGTTFYIKLPIAKQV